MLQPPVSCAIQASAQSLDNKVEPLRRKVKLAAVVFPVSQYTEH